jgi:S1-C subfamily serine protease
MRCLDAWAGAGEVVDALRKDQTLDLTKLFMDSSPSMLAFITKLSSGPKPDFPTIIGTGFFVDSSGLAATNRHVIEEFDRLPPHPKSGRSPLAAVWFCPGDDGYSWHMLVLDVLSWNALAEFTSTDPWYGQTTPDIGFVQVSVREVPTLKLATEKFYLKIGMEVATIGYPMGTVPLTALGKLNQVSPFIRHGIVSSVFPMPTALPHGFTTDIMQQGGASGSPVLRILDGIVVGMTSSGFANTNISIAEPAHIIQKALDVFRSARTVEVDKLSTLAEIRAKYPKPNESTELTWDTWTSPST